MNDDLIREGDKGYRKAYDLWEEEHERLFAPKRDADGRISSIPVRISDSDEQTDKITMEKYGFRLIPYGYSSESTMKGESFRANEVRAFRRLGVVYQVTDKPKYVQKVIMKLEEGKG